MSGNTGGVREIAARLARLLEERADFIQRLEDSVAEVRPRDIDEILSKHRLVLLFFTASWCGPCISFMQTFREVAGRLADPRVFYGYVDVDSSYSLADRYNVKHIPSIVVIVDGKPVDVIIGSLSREKLEEKVRAYMKAACIAEVAS
ncbi:MAG: thioredoxin family protein [Desulfurococcales archaeon]|nr:thioredoxin family protein [Desulfurococcales archaeon]